MKPILRDFSPAAINAGFTTVLVGYTSTVVLVFQAAQHLGASDQEISSWLLALGLGMGIPGALLSIRYRMPIALAWSTSGAALIAANTMGLTLGEATGAFIGSAVLTAIAGFTGWFARILKYVPSALASGMLAGILLPFGLRSFSALEQDLYLVVVMLGCYLLAKRFFSRYALVLPLVIGISWTINQSASPAMSWHLALPSLSFVAPEFSWEAIIGLGLPLFVVTMASQNLPGYRVVQAAGYPLPVSPVLGITGAVNALLAVFGAFAINLATLTAAICVSPAAHPDQHRRYTAGVATGVFYTLCGLMGMTITRLLIALPEALVAAIAGIALFGTIAQALNQALADPNQREVAIITFLATASGVSLWGLGSGFWGLIIGVIAYLWLNPTQCKPMPSSTKE